MTPAPSSLRLPPEDARVLDAELASPGAGINPGAPRLAAVLRAADPAAGVPVPAGLAARTAARVAAEVDAERSLEAWLGGDASEGGRFSGLAALLDAGLGDAALQGPGPGLAARTLDRLAAERRAGELSAQIDRLRGPSADAGPAVAGRIGFGSSGLRGGIRQALSAAAVLLIGSALLLPALRQSAAEAGRLACLGNLRAAGGAFARYAADFGGVLPRAGVEGHGPAVAGGLLPSLGLSRPRSAPEPAAFASGNARNLGLLADTRAGGAYLPANRLVCHGQPGEGDAAPPAPPAPPASPARIGWRVPGSAVYSYQSQAGPEPLRLEGARSDLGVLADRNPLFVLRDGRLRLRADATAMLPSRLHRGEGQNVLTAAGDARWTVRPRLGLSALPGGPAADHLWTAEGAAGAGRLVPVDVEQDAVLLP